MTLDRAVYVEECSKRWGGAALGDARRNWHQWKELHQTLEDAMRTYRHDPWQKDISDKSLNPDGTLTAFLWNLQTAITPDRSRLYPLLDFEEHFQKVFLKRGLIIYCTLILRELEQAKAAGSNLPLFASIT